MQPIRRKVKLVIFLLVAAIAVSTLIYARGGFAFGTAPEEKEILIDGGGFYYGDNIAGRKPFQQYCATCHSMEKEAVGPALMGVGERIDSDTLIKTLLLYPKKAIKSSPYLKDLYYKYDRSLHPSFQKLMTEQELKDVISFITLRGMY
jgi:hypothetical protein